MKIIKKKLRSRQKIYLFFVSFDDVLHDWLWLNISFLFLTLCVYVCQHVFVHVHTVLKGPEKGTDALELDFQTAMSCPTWVLGKKLRSSVRPDTLNLNP